MRVLYGIIISLQMSSLLAQVFELEPTTATWSAANAACAANQYSLVPGRRYRAKKLGNLLTEGVTVWLQGWRGVTDFELKADGKVKSLKVDISRNVKKGIQFVCESGSGKFFIPEGTAKAQKGASKLCVEQQGILANFSTEDYITKAFDIMEQDMPYWVGDVTTKETIAKLCLAATMKGGKLLYIYDSCSNFHNYICLKEKTTIKTFHYIVSFKMSIYKDFEVEIEEKKSLTTSSTLPTTSTTIPLSSTTVPTTVSAIPNVTATSSALPLTSSDLTKTSSAVPPTLPSRRTSGITSTTSTTKVRYNATSSYATTKVSNFPTSKKKSSTSAIMSTNVVTGTNTSVTEENKDAVTMDIITKPYTQSSTVQIQTRSMSGEVASPITTITSLSKITGDPAENFTDSSMTSIESSSVFINTTEPLSTSSPVYITDNFEQTSLTLDPYDMQTDEIDTATFAYTTEAEKSKTVKSMETSTMDKNTKYSVDEKMESVYEGTTDMLRVFTDSINSTLILISEVQTTANTDKNVPDMSTSSSTITTIHHKHTVYNVTDDVIDLSDLDFDKSLVTTDNVETSSMYVTKAVERTSGSTTFKPLGTTSIESEPIENIPTYTVLDDVFSDLTTTGMIIDLDPADTPDRDDSPTDRDMSVPGGGKVPKDYEEGNVAESTRDGEREAPNDNWELPLIIAFIIMAVAVLLAILLALYLYRRRKMQQQQEITKESDVELRAKTAVNGDKKERETATFKDSAYDV